MPLPTSLPAPAPPYRYCIALSTRRAEHVPPITAAASVGRQQRGVCPCPRWCMACTVLYFRTVDDSTSTSSLPPRPLTRLRGLSSTHPLFHIPSLSAASLLLRQSKHGILLPSSLVVLAGCRLAAAAISITALHHESELPSLHQSFTFWPSLVQCCLLLAVANSLVRCWPKTVSRRSGGQSSRRLFLSARTRIGRGLGVWRRHDADQAQWLHHRRE